MHSHHFYAAYREAGASELRGPAAMTAKNPKRPRDTNQLAKLIADIATGEKEDAPEPQESSMAKLGREGGLKGGKARAASLTPEQRRQIAQKAAKSRWSKY
jgi:hypothetical protein